MSAAGGGKGMAARTSRRYVLRQPFALGLVEGAVTEEAAAKEEGQP